MATALLTNAGIYVGAFDLSGDHNRVAVKQTIEKVRQTVFGSAGHIYRAGLADTEISGKGVWDAATSGEPDDTLGVKLVGGAAEVITVTPTRVDGDPVWMIAGPILEYSPIDTEVGESLEFEFMAKATGKGPRGTLMTDPATARTATGTGTIRQLGQVPAGSYVYSSLHVLAASGTSPSLTVRIESDDNAGMTTPTTRGTFTSTAVITAQWLTPVAGAITDTYWRVGWTISGTSPSFRFACSIGIAL